MTLFAAGEPLKLFGIRFVGLTAENGHKLLLTAAFLAVVFVLSFSLRAAAALALGGDRLKRGRFWTRQGIGLFTAWSCCWA